MKRIVVLAGIGMVGKKIFDQLTQYNYSVVVVSRYPALSMSSLPGAIAYIGWDKKDLLKYIDGSYGVINLSGAPIVGIRWTKKYKKILYKSRIDSTNLLVESINACKNKPEVLINASAVGYYGIDNHKNSFYEDDPPGDNFLAHLCEAWEKKANEAKNNNTRIVVIRSGVILSNKEGALTKLITPFKYFLGGQIGNGQQILPWIHVDDEAGIILYSLEHKNITGPINATAPERISNREFSKIVGSLLKKPSLIPIPKFILKLIYGESAQVLTYGSYASPKKISDFGYEFKYPQLKKALENLLKGQ